MTRKGLAFGGWGRGLALGRQRRRTLLELRYLARMIRQAPCPTNDDSECEPCAPAPEPKDKAENSE
jgi:hypothetical protein